jgi:hypothetical protein
VPIGIAVVVIAPGSSATATRTTATTTTIEARAQQSDAGTTARLELVEQRFATDPNGNVQLRYVLSGVDGDPLELIPPPVVEPPPPPPIVDPTAPPIPPPPPEPVPEPIAVTVEITNYSPLDDTDDIDRIVGSDVDPNAFAEVGEAVDGVAFDARPLLTLNDDGTVGLMLDIGTDVVDSIETRLKMDRPGLYPLRVQLLVGDRADRNVVVTAGTVVQRLAGADDVDVEVAPPIDLAVVAVTPTPAPDADDATVEIARARLDESIEFAATLTAPVTLEVPPTLIAEAASTPEGADRLTAALVGDELVAQPILPLDVSSAVAADRADSYTQFVQAGVDLLTEAVPTVPNRRDVWITTEPLSAGGAQHLRDIGTRFVVIPADLYAASIDGELPPTDRFVDAALPDGGTLPFLVVDPLAEQLSEAGADRILARSTSIEWGIETLTALLVDQATDDAVAGESTSASVGRPPAPARRSRVLTTPDLSSPDARLLGALEQLVETTPAVRFTAASALAGVTDVLLDDGDPVTVALPDVAGPDLGPRVELLDRTAVELASAASMLPDDDPRPAEWTAQLDVLISTGYSDADVEAATAELLAEADTLKQAVSPPEPFTFTLTGRSGTIEIQITNTIDEPLDVIVALDSTKVTFPLDDQLVRLRPLDETSVFVPVEAESNGTSSITLVVSTPAGEPLGDPVTLTARVTALTGLGQVLTGGFVLVLLTWWFTHWRNRRRAALTGDGRERHPSTSKVESDAL